MKPPQFYVTIAIGGLCLVLSVWAIVLSHSDSTLQSNLQNQQAQINSAAQIEQVRQQIVNDMGQASLKDDKIKQVLTFNGYTVTAKPSPSPTSSPSPSK